MTGFLRFQDVNGYQEYLIPVDRIVSVSGWTEKAQRKKVRSTITYLQSHNFWEGTTEITVDLTLDELETLLNRALGQNS